MKKLLAILLAALMVLSMFAFVACDNGKDTEKEKPDDSEKDNEGDADSDAIDEEMKVTLSDATLDIPEDAKDICDNRDFTIFAPTPWGIDRFVVEEPNGTPENDAKYYSNLAILDTLGVTIKAIDKGAYTHDQAEFIINSVIAGDHEFQAAAIHTTSACAALIMGNAVLSFDNLEYCDLSKPWWIQNFSEAITMFDQVYFGINSSCHNFYRAPVCLLYNKDLAEENNLPDFYDLVRRGEWTIDKMIEVTKNFSKDLNSDGIFDYNDQLAIYSGPYTMNGWYGAFNQPTVVKGDTDELEIVVNSNRMVEVIEELNTLFNTGRRGTVCAVNDPDAASYKAAFSEGRILFFLTSAGDATSLREYDLNFGIIPMPKFNQEQENYGSWVDPWHLAFCVPSDVEDPEFVSIVLESLGYHYYRNVYPAIVEQSIFGTGTRDVDSLEMLEDYIFPNVYFEFGYLFDSWGVGYGNMIRELITDKSTDVASYVSGKLNKAQNHYDDLYEAARSLAGA